MIASLASVCDFDLGILVGVGPAVVASGVRNLRALTHSTGKGTIPASAVMETGREANTGRFYAELHSLQLWLFRLIEL